MSVIKSSRLAMMAGAVAAATLFGAGSANALLLDNWTNITNNGNTNVGSQLAVDVTDAGGGKVNFRFTNNIGVASSITDIYFDDKSVSLLGSVFSLSGSAGVSFSLGAAPPNLPGGNDISFSADFSADSNSPGVPNNGINAPSEWLDITFNLTGGKTFADVLSQIDSGELVLGMHVQAIAPQGGSDSYINDTTTTQVPEPATLALLGMGLLGLGAVRRRRA